MNGYVLRARVALLILAALWLGGCKGGGGGVNPTGPSATVTAKVVVIGDGRPVVGANISTMDRKVIATTGSDGVATFTVADGTPVMANAFGFKEYDFYGKSSDQTINMVACNDIEITALYADGVEVKDGGTIYYPTTLKAIGRYRIVSQTEREVIGRFDFVQFVGGTTTLGAPSSNGTWENTLLQWEPCKYTFEPEGPRCAIMYSDTKFLQTHLLAPYGGRDLATKLVSFNLAFAKR